MSKKILGICAALVALAALAIPASASAATTLRDTVNNVLTPLAPGAKITALSEEDAIFKAGSAEIKCNENWLTGEVHVNSDTEGITGTITAAQFAGSYFLPTDTKCDGGSLLGHTTVDIPALTNSGGTGHWCIKNIPGVDEFEVLGRGCTETGNGTLTFGLTGSINCWYKREAGVNGTFTTTSHPNPATLSVTGNPKFARESPSNFLCPSEGEITQMKFKLYTDRANESESTANPVEIANTP